MPVLDQIEDRRHVLDLFHHIGLLTQFVTDHHAGIKEPGILEITNLKGGKYEVILGEGNHRLRIAHQLGKDTFPLSFYYKFG